MRGLRGALAAVAALALSLATASGAGAVKYPNTPSGSISGSSVALAPGGLAVDDSTGNLYVANLTTEFKNPIPKVGILRFDPGGSPLTPASMGSGNFTGVAVQQGGAHNVYAFDRALQGTPSLNAFDSGGNALGSPFPFNVNVLGFPQIGSDVAGNIYLPDLTTKSVKKYTSSGAVGTPAEFKCTSGDCLTLVEPNSVAVDANGRVYVSDPGTLNEQQEVSVDATGGTFALSFEGQKTGGTGSGDVTEFDATGSGDLSEGSSEVTNLLTSTGAFANGQEVEGPGIPPATTISEVISGENKLILSQAAEAGGTGSGVSLQVRSRKVTGLNTSTGAFVVGEQISGTGIATGTTITAVPGGGVLELSAPTTGAGSGVALSAALGFDAGAATVQGALEALSTVGAGNVSVSGGPLYTVEFTSALGKKDIAQLVADPSGLTGGAATANVSTTQVGQSSRVIRFDADGSNPTVFRSGLSESVAVDTSKGLVFVGGRTGVGFNYKVTVYDLAGNEVGSFGDGTIVDQQPTDEPNLHPQIAVNSSNGLAYVSQSALQDPSVARVWIFAPIAEPTATTNPASNVTGTGAKLKGTVNPAEVATESCVFQYTDDADFQANEWANATSVPCVPNPGSASTPTAVSATVSGLSPLTSYQYRVVEQTEGGTAAGSAVKFTTNAPAPKATTEAATGISQSAATLNGKVDAEGGEAECSFEYGTTTAYGKSVPCSTTPVTGTAPTAVTGVLSGLNTSTTYHYRLVAKSSGGTVKGGDMTLTTPAAPSGGGGTPGGSTPPPSSGAPAPAPPATKPLKCKKGFKKKKVKGKQKCVKVKKKKKK